MLKDLPKILREVAVQSATVILVTAVANILGWILIHSQAPQLIAANLMSFSARPLVILLLLNLFLLFLGCFMEVIASVVILTPILVPALVQIGVNPVHFGVVMTLNLMIGLLTPPFGMGLLHRSEGGGESPFTRVARGNGTIHRAAAVGSGFDHRFSQHGPVSAEHAVRKMNTR